MTREEMIAHCDKAIFVDDDLATLEWPSLEVSSERADITQRGLSPLASLRKSLNEKARLARQDAATWTERAEVWQAAIDAIDRRMANEKGGGQ